MLRRFWKNEEGATAIEYGLIAAILCVGIVAGVMNLRNSLNDKYNNVASSVGQNY